MSKEYDVIVIGGGIIGMSTAMAAGMRIPAAKILVLEKENSLAAHQTGHNSGVIHSGLYYKPGSLKAKTCVRGAAELVTFCREQQIPHEICGKVIVATSVEELEPLEELYRRSVANSVPGVRKISKDELLDLEPHSAGIRALHVPTTGIVDYAAVTLKYGSIFQQRGGEIRTGARVTGLLSSDDKVVVETNQGAFETKLVVNCAGLHSDRVGRMAGDNSNIIIVPFRGEYYELIPEKRYLVRNLIYPVPDMNLPFLAVHFTRRLNGAVEAGPNAVLAFKREGYKRSDIELGDCWSAFSYPGFWRMSSKYWKTGLQELYRSFHKKAFTRGLKKLIPDLSESDLRPGGSGVRAQALDRDGKLLDDFYIVQKPRMIHVYNVPSPAATASLAIGRQIAEMIQPSFSQRGMVAAG